MGAAVEPHHSFAYCVHTTSFTTYGKLTPFWRLKRYPKIQIFYIKTMQPTILENVTFPTVFLVLKYSISEKSFERKTWNMQDLENRVVVCFKVAYPLVFLGSTCKITCPSTSKPFSQSTSHPTQIDPTMVLCLQMPFSVHRPPSLVSFYQCTDIISFDASVKGCQGGKAWCQIISTVLTSNTPLRASLTLAL